MIKALLFDFFGVISSEVAPVWFDGHFDSERARLFKARVFERADLGIISEEQSYIEMEAMTGVPRDKIKEEFYSLVVINTELVDYIRALRERYPVYLLSNAATPFLRNILDRYELNDLFDGVFISSEIARKKPSRDYFEYALGKIGISPTEAFFTDDNPENVSAARALGISAEVFSGVKPLKRALLSLGLR